MPESNIAILYDDLSPKMTFSGGSWQTASMVLANLKTPYVPEVARSKDLQLSSTQFRAAIQGSSSLLGGFAVGPGNFSPLAKVRIVVYRDIDATQVSYDSGWKSFGGLVVPSLSLPWASANWWTGQSDFDDFAKGNTMIIIPDNPVSGLVCDVFIDDQNNPSGYLDLGRFFAGRKYVPDYNYDVDNNELNFEPITDVEQGLSGTRFFNPRAIRRVFKFQFSNLPDPAFAQIYKIAVRSGLHNQVVVIPNPADPTTYVREAFIGNLDELPSLKRLYGPYMSTGFVIKEAI